MFERNSCPHRIEPLEARIAPATVVATVAAAEAAYDANPSGDQHFVKAQFSTSIILSAGQVLSTSQVARDGTYLLSVEKGSMRLFVTDLNNNGEVDFNEITGIAAGDGLRFTSFVDIHGPIVTNLDADGSLSDSNNNSDDDDDFLKGDGLVLNNSRIESITLRSLTPADLTDQNRDGVVDATDVELRLALSSYSIHGQVLAGKGFGVVGDTTSGLCIDSTGNADQATKFDGRGLTYYIPSKPTIGAIRTGTAASGEYFSFGISQYDDLQGTLRNFTPPKKQVGGDIYNIRGADQTVIYNLSGLYAGNGGLGARGGNIDTVVLNGENASGYQIIAGNGGSGATGGPGGSILGFTDLGSVTGQVLLNVGTGGTGTTAAGGSGGTLGLGTLPATGVGATQPLVNISVNGGFEVRLGDGGSGFTAGGNGANLAKMVITTPEGTVEYGRAVVSTTHDGPHDPITGKLIRDPIFKGTIGRSIPVDIDQDGFSDIVFTTTEPEQLVVQFGDGLGGFRLNPVTGRPDRIYLDGPIGAEALAVGDFNGDGHQDIAVASSDVGNYAGVQVFLAKWEDANSNGLTPGEDLNQNGTDDFRSFFTPRTSVLPSLASGDPNGAPYLNFFYGYSRSANAINDLAVGDFNGDGYTEIAVAATYITIRSDLTAAQNQILMILTPDLEDGRQTGQFYADVGTKKTTVPNVGANPYVPFALMGGSNDARIEATGLSTVAAHDVVVGQTVLGTNSVNGSTNTGIASFVDIYDFSVRSVYGPQVGSVSFGQVDTNRSLMAPITLAGAFVRDFTLTDFNHDGLTDYAAVTENPDGFLVAAQGDGQGSAIVVTVNPLTANNAGFFFGPQGLGAGTEQFAIRATQMLEDFDDLAARPYDDLAILSYGAAFNTRPGYVIYEASIWDFLALDPMTVSTNPGVDVIFPLAFGLTTPSLADTNVVAFDTFIPQTNFPEFINYATAIPATNPGNFRGLESFGDYGYAVTPLVENFVAISAGDGGNGTTGRGGDGGVLGGAITELTVPNPQLGTATSLFGAIDITIPLNTAYAGLITLTGGNGGNGFTTGGSGGGVLGANIHYITGTMTYHTEVVLQAGNGGLGISAAGGNGGSLIANALETGTRLVAGDGGRGKTGGHGGSIIGHNKAAFPDNREPSQVMYAGAGGNGVKRGGDGGSITDYHGQFDLFIPGGTFGLINYVAGDAGTAVSGAGGNGGDVLDVSPFVQGDGQNRMSGDVYLRGGAGGNGLSGGRGGDVGTFLNRASEQDSPAVLSFLGGDGGDATKGKGGRGGNVANLQATSKGAPSIGAAPLEDGVPEQTATGNRATSTRGTVYTFNRMIAGDGGSSSGNTGGGGGGISNINTGSSQGSYAIVAGAGGTGLYAGGDGGPVNGVRVDFAGGAFGKALIIAGAGGDAGAFIANPSDPSPNQAQKAFGGRVGHGGDGGNINNVTQLGADDAHADLIAGNGGDTVFYGRISNLNSFVGKGGSVSNVTMDGTLGNIVGTVPIKSYNDVKNGQSVADFVRTVLRDRFAPGQIGDDIGNVGVVVGAAGRLKSIFAGFDELNRPIYQSLPSFTQGNGSLSTVRVGSILAAVAGNVERIASILSVRNVVVGALGKIGTEKTLVPESFLDKNGNVVPDPVVDGLLIDGAMVVATQPVASSNDGKIVVLPG